MMAAFQRPEKLSRSLPDVWETVLMVHHGVLVHPSIILLDFAETCPKSKLQKLFQSVFLVQLALKLQNHLTLPSDMQIDC